MVIDWSLDESARGEALESEESEGSLESGSGSILVGAMLDVRGV